MTAKKQSRASQRKALAGQQAWDVTYVKYTPARLKKLGLVKRQYSDVIGEMALLRNMVVKTEYVISAIMEIRNATATRRLEALKYGIMKMTPVDVMHDGIRGRVGGANAFRPLPNRSVRENASGKNRQLGTPRQLFQEGTCPTCQKEIGLDITHWKGGRSSLACCHVIPEAMGGTTDQHNVVIACAECNYQQGSYVDATALYELSQITVIVPIGWEYPQ